MSKGQALWQKILGDTESVDKLSSKQRHWRCLALIRTGKTKDAEDLFLSGEITWQGELRNQLLGIDIDVSLRRIQKADEELCHLYTDIENDTEMLKTWTFLANRLSQKSPKLMSLLQRDQKETKSTLICKDHSDWERAMKLKQNTELFENYLNWMRWCLQNQQAHNVPKILEKAIKNCRVHPKDHTRCFRLLRDSDHIEYFLDCTLVSATQNSRSPRDTWSYWHRELPRNRRPHLRSEMKSYLSKYPNRELEELLDTLEVT